MKMNEFYARLRDALQRGIYFLIDPPVRLMGRIGMTPNMVTTLGFVGNALSAVLLALSALTQESVCLWHVGVVGWLILFSSLFDMLDGRLARTTGQATPFGAFYDSVLDRYCELLTLGALTFYFLRYGHALFSLVTLLSLIGSIMVSYVRARAEGLGQECKVGLMQRPERVVLTALGAILTPPLGLWALLIPQLLIALLANLTAIVRILHVRRSLSPRA